jgi:hypothetical protein
MHIIKKLLILVIVCITFVIIHNLLKTRAEIKLQAQRELNQRSQEGFGESEIETMKKSSSPLSIGPVPQKYLDLPLREFMVKSSYNSAISGDYANSEAIRVVLKKGCRLLDFEIYTVDDNEYVSYSDDFQTMDTQNKDSERLTLTNALSAVSSSAFTSSACPSPDDPLFIMLRIKGTDQNNGKKDIYKRVAGALKTAFPSTLYQKGDKAIQVDGGTLLKDIMKKVIIIFDTDGKMSNYDTLCTSSNNDCSEIYNVVNLPAHISGGLEVYSYDDILNKPIDPVFSKRDGLGTTIDRFIMVMPPKNDLVNIPKPSDVVAAGLPQFLLYKFYADPNNLEDYENIFNYAKSSFVPMSSVISSSSSDTTTSKKQKIAPAVPKAPALPLGSAPLLKNILQ